MIRFWRYQCVGVESSLIVDNVNCTLQLHCIYANSSSELCEKTCGIDLFVYKECYEVQSENVMCIMAVSGIMTYKKLLFVFLFYFQAQPQNRQNVFLPQT